MTSEAVIATHTAQRVSATLTLIVFLGLSFWPLRPMLISNQAYAYLKSGLCLSQIISTCYIYIIIVSINSDGAPAANNVS